MLHELLGLMNHKATSMMLPRDYMVIAFLRSKLKNFVKCMKKALLDPTLATDLRIQLLGGLCLIHCIRVVVVVMNHEDTIVIICCLAWALIASAFARGLFWLHGEGERGRRHGPSAVYDRFVKRGDFFDFLAALRTAADEIGSRRHWCSLWIARVARDYHTKYLHPHLPTYLPCRYVCMPILYSTIEDVCTGWYVLYVCTYIYTQGRSTIPVVLFVQSLLVGLRTKKKSMI